MLAAVEVEPPGLQGPLKLLPWMLQTSSSTPIAFAEGRKRLAIWRRRATRLPQGMIGKALNELHITWL